MEQNLRFAVRCFRGGMDGWYCAAFWAYLGDLDEKYRGQDDV